MVLILLLQYKNISSLALVFICHLVSPSRLHDVCGRAAVCRVGPFLWHTSVPDHAWPHGAEQGQLEWPTAGTNLRLRGGGAQHGRHRRRRRCRPKRRQHRRNQLQRNTSGKQRILTLLVCPFTSTSWPLTLPASGLTTHWGPGGACYGLQPPCRCPTWS